MTKAPKFSAEEIAALVESENACDFSPVQAKALDFMRTMLEQTVKEQPTLKPCAEFSADIRLMRFLRANAWDCNGAWKEYCEAIKFRRDRHMDSVRDQIVTANKAFFEGGSVLHNLYLHPASTKAQRVQPRMFTKPVAAIAPPPRSAPAHPAKTAPRTRLPARPRPAPQRAFHVTAKLIPAGGNTNQATNPVEVTAQYLHRTPDAEPRPEFEPEPELEPEPDPEPRPVPLPEPEREPQLHRGHEILLDRHGNLVMIECPGTIDYAGIFELGTAGWSESTIWHMEMRSLIIDELSRRSGKMKRVCSLLDFSGFKMSIATGLGASKSEKEGYKAWKQVASLISQAYPDTTYKNYVIGIAGGWLVNQMIQALAPKRSAKKFALLGDGEDAVKKVYADVEPINLPRRFGGELDNGDQWPAHK
uniref:CRAL-TRIO domain-containing protein n=1 Tax=Chrysotila carterae TaxID=13221 RepID=A0A7S4BFZ7_CHRCT